MTDEPAIETPPRGPWIKRVVRAAIGLLALATAGLYGVTRFLDPVQLAQWIEPRIESALGRDVEIERARVDLFPPVGIALEDVTVADPLDTSGEPFATIEALRLDLSLRRLIQRRVEIDEIRIESPVVRHVVRSDGTSNAEGIGPVADSPAGGETSAPFQVDIGSIRVENGVVHHRDDRQGSQAAVTELETRLSLRPTGAGWAIEGRIRGRAGLETGGDVSTVVGPHELEFDIAAEAPDDLKSVALGESRLRIDQIPLTVSGRWDRGVGNESAISVRTRGDSIDIATVIALLPSGTMGNIESVAGAFSLDVALGARLGATHPIDVSGSAGLLGVTASLDGAEPIVEELTGDIYLSRDSAWTTNLEGSALGGPLRLRGLVRAGDRVGFVVRVAAQPDLQRAQGMVAVPDSVALTGGLSIDLTARGMVDDPTRALLTGRVEADGLSLTMPGVGVPVSVPQGTVLLDGDVVRWRDLPLGLGSDRFTTSGELRDVLAWARDGVSVPIIQASIAGDRFDFDAVFPGPPPDSTVLYGRLVFARLGDRAVGGRDPRDILAEREFARPDSVPLSGHVAVSFGQFLSAPWELEDLRADVEIRPDLVQVRDLSAAAYGGQITTNVDFGLGSSWEPFSFSLVAEGVGAGDFLSATSPLGRAFDGTLSLRLEVSGDMDDVFLPNPGSVLGSGSFALRDGAVHAGPVNQVVARLLGAPELDRLALRDWSAPLLLSEGRVVLRESVLQGAFGTPRLAGSVGFGGQLALDLLVRLPAERVDSAALSRLGVQGELLQRLRARSQSLDAMLRIAGSVSNPELSVNQTGAAQSIAEAVEDEAEAQVQDAIEERKQALEDRAAEAVDRILGAQDTTRTRPPGLPDLRRLIPGNPFRARPDSTPAADSTAQPDTLPADTLRGDTIRPDTTRGP